MSKANGSGSRAKKQKNKTAAPINDYLPIKEDGQCYGLVTKLVGNGRVTVRCEDGNEKLGIIPGKFKRGEHKAGEQRIVQGTIVLVNIRDFQESKVDIIYVYIPNDAKKLRKLGELKNIPENDPGEKSEESDEVHFDSDEEINLEDL